MSGPIAGETLGGFLTRRREELEAQISALRGQLTPREEELAQINKIRALIADATAAGLVDNASKAVIGPTVVDVPDTLLINNVEVKLTIKGMILNALRDHFDSGATPTQL